MHDFIQWRNLVLRLEQQVRDLQSQLEQFRRVREPVLVTPAASSTRKLAALTSTLSQGGTAMAREITYEEGVPVWATDETFEVTDWWLNLGEDDVPADTKIIAEQFGDTWIVAEFYCAASDTLPTEE